MPRGQAKQSDTQTGVSDCSPGAEGASPTLVEKLLDKILDSINKRFDRLEEKLEILTNNQTALTNRVEEVEEQVSDHERRILVLEQKLIETQRTNEKLSAKINDLEGHSRRNNIKIVGIPEGEESGRPTEFVTGLIPKLFGASNLSKPVTVDRAHRVPLPRRNMDTKRPRTIIARIHFYQEKELLLRLSRNQELIYNGLRVFVFPDYTAEVTAQRRAFREVMNILREKAITFTLRYPARLHVQYNDQVKVFTSPTGAETFIKKDLHT